MKDAAFILTSIEDLKKERYIKTVLKKEICGVLSLIMCAVCYMSIYHSKFVTCTLELQDKL